MKNEFRIGVVFIIGISITLLSTGWGKTERSLDDCLQIAVAGAGFVMDANAKKPEELMQLAVACKNGGGTLFLKNCNGLKTNDLLGIATAGKGHVVIDF